MLTFYLVGERVKYRDVYGKYKTSINIYRKGYKNLKNAYIKNISYAELLRLAKEHNTTVESATKFFIDQNNMWLSKQSAENFITRYSTIEHPLFLITVKW